MKHAVPPTSRKSGSRFHFAAGRYLYDPRTPEHRWTCEDQLWLLESGYGDKQTNTKCAVASSRPCLRRAQLQTCRVSTLASPLIPNRTRETFLILSATRGLEHKRHNTSRLKCPLHSAHGAAVVLCQYLGQRVLESLMAVAAQVRYVKASSQGRKSHAEHQF